MQTALIDYFKKGIVSSDKSDNRDFAAINKKAVKLGYIISPECCNKFVDEWLDTLTANYNSTFYKEWNDVISKSRFELFVDQIRHYSSTYGKLEKGEEPVGNGWTPNDGGITPRFEDLKVIEPITKEELAGKCFDVLKSGIALKDSTMKVLCDFWYDVRVKDVDWKKKLLCQWNVEKDSSQTARISIDAVLVEEQDTHHRRVEHRPVAQGAVFVEALLVALSRHVLLGADDDRGLAVLVAAQYGEYDGIVPQSRVAALHVLGPQLELDGLIFFSLSTFLFSLSTFLVPLST